MRSHARKGRLPHTGLLLANSLLVLRQSCRPGGSYIDRTQRNFERAVRP